MKIATISIDLAEMPRLKQMFPNLLKVSIEFAISCPRCGCEADKIMTTDKKDRVGKDRPVYRCQECHAEFTADHSKFARVVQHALLERLTMTRFKDNVPQQVVARLLGLSQPTTSRLETQIIDFLNQPKQHHDWARHVSTSPEDAHELSPQEPLVFIIDETWEVDAGTSENIIQVVNDALSPIAIKVSSTRNAADLTEVLAEAITVKGLPWAIVADGSAAAAAAVKDLQYSGLFIQHLHAAPRGRITISKSERLGECGCHIQWVIGARSSLPKKEGHRWYHFMYRLERCSWHACLCDPTWCAKNDHHPLCEPCQVAPELRAWECTWKNASLPQVFTKGLPFVVIQNGANAPPEVLGEGLTILPPAVRELVLERIKTLLHEAWYLFCDKYVTTNPVESTHSYLHPLLRNRGSRHRERWPAIVNAWKMIQTAPRWVARQLKKMTRRVSEPIFRAGLAVVVQQLFLEITFRYTMG